MSVPITCHGYLGIEVTYLGHKLTGEGVKPDQSKVDAILNMPAPNDKQGVQRLLGMVNYLTKFIPHLTPCNVYYNKCFNKIVSCLYIKVMVIS